jgi:hypothetical protein
MFSEASLIYHRPKQGTGMKSNILIFDDDCELIPNLNMD